MATRLYFPLRIELESTKSSLLNLKALLNSQSSVAKTFCIVMEVSWLLADMVRDQIHVYQLSIY
jgi:hypothetical protein